MRDFFRKAAAIMAAAVITASAAVSCSSKSSFSSDPNNLIGGDLPDDYSKDLEDMPYGGEYQKFEAGDNDFPMGIDMDPRFVTIDEASALTNYFYSVNKQDVESFKKAVHPDLIKYRLENSEYSTEQEFLDAEYELLKQYTGSDFTFDYKDTEGAFEQYDKLVETAIPGCDITSRNMYMVDVTYHKPNDGGSYSLRYRFGDYMNIAIYTIDGKAYVIS